MTTEQTQDQPETRPSEVRSDALLAAGIWPLVAAGQPEHAARLLDAATGRRRPQELTARPCALPGCAVMTTHNGGYCCSDHCREHRQRQRASNAQVDFQKGARSADRR